MSRDAKNHKTVSNLTINRDKKFDMEKAELFLKLSYSKFVAYVAIGISNFLIQLGIFSLLISEKLINLDYFTMFLFLFIILFSWISSMFFISKIYLGYDEILYLDDILNITTFVSQLRSEMIKNKRGIPIDWLIKYHGFPKKGQDSNTGLTKTSALLRLAWLVMILIVTGIMLESVILLMS